MEARLPGAFVAMACPANAKTSTTPFDLSRPTLGGAGVSAPAQPLRIGASKGDNILRHRGPKDGPRLSIYGYARPHM